MKETDLFEPIKNYLEERGYDVYQEVQGIDVVGINRQSGKVVLIEMKLHFNIKVMQQVLRNKMNYPDAEHYIAIPKNGWNDFTKSDYEKIELLNLTFTKIGMLGVTDYGKVIHLRDGGADIKSTYYTFNKACSSLQKKKTAGAKSGETLTERQIIIDRTVEVLKVLPGYKCDLDDLIYTLIPSILKHYSGKSSFVSVMRNTAYQVFDIHKNEISLKDVKE